MDEQLEIEKLKSEGYDKVWVYEAEPDEIDESHSHDYDTKLIILRGEISVAFKTGDAILNKSYVVGDEVVISKNKSHSAKVGPSGCRYIVAEKN